MKLGFVGTGAITEAVVTGLMKSRTDISSVIVSPRSAHAAFRLAEMFPLVRVGVDNQDVVDSADIVFLAVRPQIAEEVVKQLRFRQQQQVVSFIAAVQIEALAGWIGAPVTITRTIPLPFVAELRGATAIYPPNEQVAELFSSLGTAVQAENLKQYDLFGAASALMATYFGLLETSAHWLEAEGMSYDQASLYLKQLFGGLSHVTDASKEQSFEAMASEFSTKGGLNEQVFTEFTGNGGTKALTLALDSVLKRIEQS
ncbi:pyrroline-5-carboxylate reductase [Phyllobacterium zundukense]|uniref:Pyrroline-5-carboxylate reductase n=1 Tax=Phyllobacterium zundukense TaxID=1867719 RepID=A0A2N9W4F7_9HYPH|nr:pyrroline-5-carboxylate reductase [Phyllobacterium zundukense]ATU91906.1 pyrroline-5-carboxylate reductase [Phyllobacterium zundukense]PIO46625.1 pyrroline-5-carboxylate reductase [Phyllobacterium zundukense]